MARGSKLSVSNRLMPLPAHIGGAHWKRNQANLRAQRKAWTQANKSPTDLETQEMKPEPPEAGLRKPQNPVPKKAKSPVKKKKTAAPKKSATAAKKKSASTGKKARVRKKTPMLH